MSRKRDGATDDVVVIRSKPKGRTDHVRDVMITLFVQWEHPDSPGSVGYLSWDFFVERGADIEVVEYLCANGLVKVKYPTVSAHRGLNEKTAYMEAETTELRPLDFYGRSDLDGRTWFPVLAITPVGIGRARGELADLARSKRRVGQKPPKPLSGKAKAAFEYIREHPGAQGKVVASEIGCTFEHFRSGIVPKLTPYGVVNHGDGYCAPCPV